MEGYSNNQKTKNFSHNQDKGKSFKINYSGTADTSSSTRKTKVIDVMCTAKEKGSMKILYVKVMRRKHYKHRVTSFTNGQ